MPSPDLTSGNFETEIQLQQDLRTKMNSIDVARDEFLRDVDKIRMEDECLRDFKSLLEELLTEKMALVNELRHVNTDINLLEQAIKQAEASRQKNMDSAHKTYVNDMVPLCRDINEIRDNMGKERLPATLVDARDLEEVFPTDRKSNGAAETPVEPPNLAPTIWPYPFQHGMYGQQIPTLRHPALYSLLSLFSGIQAPGSTSQSEEAPGGGGGMESGRFEQSPPAPSHDNVTAPSGGSSFGHVDTMGSSSGMLPKQQQPPMKTCASCQQQIHRNAPICPLCKSKSRSRHPKKKQRASKSDEPQQD